MASTTTLQKCYKQKLGYRCFTVTAEAIEDALIVHEGKQSKDLRTMYLCDGQVSGKRKKDIYILKH